MEVRGRFNIREMELDSVLDKSTYPCPDPDV